MRSGGPRLLCSPYFVIVLFVILVFISMKYYSISAENDTLAMRIEVLQNQMKMTSSNLKSLDSTLTSKTEALQECNNQRIRAEEKSKQLEQEKDSREALVHRLKDEVNNKHKALEKLQTENVNLYVANDSISDAIQKLNEEIEQLKNKNENIEQQKTECQNLENRVAELEEQLKDANSELANLGAEKVQGKENMKVHESGGNPNGPILQNGELPDVNPDAVHIRQPALMGNTYHQDPQGNYLPILPRGDPNKPRATPRFSVAGLNPAQKNLDSKKAKRDDDSALTANKIEPSNISDVQVQNQSSPKPSLKTKSSTLKSIDSNSPKNQSVGIKVSNVDTINDMFDISNVQSPVTVEIQRPTEYPIGEENLIQEPIIFDTTRNLTENVEITPTTKNLNAPTDKFIGIKSPHQKSEAKAKDKLQTEENNKQVPGLIKKTKGGLQIDEELEAEEGELRDKAQDIKIVKDTNNNNKENDHFEGIEFEDFEIKGKGQLNPNEDEGGKVNSENLFNVPEDDETEQK